MIPVSLISGYLGAGKTTLLNDILRDPKGLKLVVLVNEFGDINIDMALISHRSDDAIALTNGCACCAIGDDLTGALASIERREESPDAVIIEASGVANLEKLRRAPANFPGFRVAQGLTLIDTRAIGQLLRNKFVSNTVRDQINDADQLMLTKTDIKGPDFSLDQIVSDSTNRPPTIERPIFLNELVDQLTMTTQRDVDKKVKPNEHAEHQQHWVELGDIAMDRLRAFLQSPGEGVVRIKGFVSSGRRQFLVQADTGGFAIEESRLTPPGQGLQIIGTARLNAAAVIASVRLIESENA